MKKLVLGLLLVAACGSDGAGELFTPKPECTGQAVEAFTGSHPQVISKLAIGSVEDGFDLDHDGKPDNKMAAVSSLAQESIDSSFKNYDILIPIEYFDFDTVAADTCVKFAIYIAKYVTDTDDDGDKAFVHNGDCNDKVAAIKRGATEDMNDGIDNDCDGLADEDAQNAPSNKGIDDDTDGQTIAQGDCNDHNNTIKKGAAEICGDGLDNDCDGVADRTEDGAGNATACSPFDSGKADLTLDPLSLSGNQPLIAFKDGTVDSSLKLVAGPSVFSVNIPVYEGLDLELRISGATIEGTLAADGTTMNGRLGGVIGSNTADTIRGLDVSQIGLTPENSLLDATFANLLGPLLALPKASMAILKKYPNCRTPDIDVDGDGLEAFCDSNLNDDDKSVDVCIDGDGTEIKDTDALECGLAMKDGKPRFVDGISVEMNFQTTAVKSIKAP
jgi:hypothetical protein